VGVGVLVGVGLGYGGVWVWGMVKLAFGLIGLFAAAKAGRKGGAC